MARVVVAAAPRLAALEQTAGEEETEGRTSRPRRRKTKDDDEDAEDEAADERAPTDSEEAVLPLRLLQPDGVELRLQVRRLWHTFGRRAMQSSVKHVRVCPSCCVPP